MFADGFPHLDAQHVIRPPAVRDAGRQAHAILELEILIAGINQIHLVAAIVFTLAG